MFNVYSEKSKTRELGEGIRIRIGISYILDANDPSKYYKIDHG